jgi:hypothetical protein
MKQKLFIIAPQFPPSFSPPAQRARLLVKHSTSYNYESVVFTVKPERREEATDTWMEELAGNNYSRVIVKCLDQNTTRKIKIGDLGLRMLPFLPYKVIAKARKEKPAFILYLVPPWYILIAAPIIKLFTSVPYGIDFIDPWVYEVQPGPGASFKKRASQRIARFFEGWVCKHASVIYSVSQGINDNLLQRHPGLQKKEMHAIPYGAEESDFKSVQTNVQNGQEKKTIRYIGAIWDDCYPVLDGLMPAIKKVAEAYLISTEFIGTNYASGKFAKPQLQKWIHENQLQDFVLEQPERVEYRRAVELTMDASLLLLIGGMQPYYAASKLMGLVVSGKLFVAFVHKDSFPAKLLSEVGYPYVVTYSSNENDLPVNKITELAGIIQQALTNEKQFTSINLEHPLIKQNTAAGMTERFLEPIKKITASI